MAQIKTAPPRGILGAEHRADIYYHARYIPAPDLEHFVEHYWTVAWDLRGREPHLQEVLSHPSVHLVFEKGNSRIVGVVRRKFSYLLTAAGRVFGIKFKPGGFYPFLASPMNLLTDRCIPIGTIFTIGAKMVEETILAQNNEESIAIAEDLLRGQLPAPDEKVEMIGNIIGRIVSDRAIITVEALADRINMNKRAVQRLFSRYVGVSPKWVIQRYRLHEAAAQMSGSAPVDWPQLALDLGYFDQAHFIKDFKAIVGTSPAEYIRKAHPGSAGG